MSDARSATKISGPPAIGNLRRAGQALVLGLVVAGIAAAWRWRGEFDPLTLTALIRSHPAAPLVFLALHLVASLTFVPRSLLGFAAGIVFGVWWGLLWSALGSVIGAVAGFLLARYVHAGFFQHARWSRFTALLERAERGGWRTVTLVRLVPVIPHSLSNYALGLTRLRLGDYALGSLLGQLPLTVAAVDLGAAGERAMRGASDWMVPTLIGASALALTVVIPAAARRRRGRGE
ncbi:MAG TPA: TVP38/TMEM64 family protein [Stellaceae bacterium]|nr:TVP38/TMEM64 family protein [Stellaceae bacterium]